MKACAAHHAHVRVNARSLSLEERALGTRDLSSAVCACVRVCACVIPSIVCPKSQKREKVKNENENQLFNTQHSIKRSVVVVDRG